MLDFKGEGNFFVVCKFLIFGGEHFVFPTLRLKVTIMRSLRRFAPQDDMIL